MRYNSRGFQRQAAEIARILARDEEVHDPKCSCGLCYRMRSLREENARRQRRARLSTY